MDDMATLKTRITKSERRDYIPALGFHRLTPLYDAVVGALLNENRFKRLVVTEATLEPGHRVLDLGCGTGTLTLMLKKSCREAHVFGLDIDEAVLTIARKKAATEDTEITFRQGPIHESPQIPGLAKGSFDCVVSSLVFHHLTSERKRQTLDQALELLKPGGRLIIADWGKAANIAMRAAFLVVQLTDGFLTTSDNVKGLLPRMIEESGFINVDEFHRQNTAIGTISCYRSIKEAS